MAEKQGVPPSVYKNAIDLNRYSNNVSKKLVRSYNRIVLDAANELTAMGAEEYAVSYRARRLRMILGSLKTSLDGWAGDASTLMKGELTELANVETQFALTQLLNQVPGAEDLLKELTVSPQFAQAVVDTDPTALNQIVLSDRLEEKVLPGARDTFQLGAKQGATISLPNGQPLSRALRGIASSSADKFRMVVQDGLLIGDSMDKMVRKIVGSQGGMRFASEAVNVRQLAQAGGQITGLANHQIMTLVRTSVTQVSNVATQETYKANREITDNFIFVATLDSRTSLTCASKDGKEYSYDDGPVPPLHFNCRSTTVAVPNWKRLKSEYGIEPPDEPALRASKDGPVPAGETYGKWLYDKRLKTPEGKYLGPGPVQIEALGEKKAIYFNRLAARKGSNGDIAIRKLVSTDGTEKTLTQIVKENKLRPITSVGVPPIVKSTKAVAKGESPSIAQLQIMSGGAKVGAADVNKVFDLMDEMEGVAGENARKLRRFTEKKQVACIWSTQREGTIVKNRSKMDHVLKSAQVKKSMERALKNEKAFISNTKDVYRTILDNAINVDEKQSGPFSKLSFASGEVKRYFTAQGKGRSRMNGMTFPGANHILIKRKADMRPITSLTQMREDVKEAVKTAKKGKYLYWSANGEGMFKGKSHWLKTYVHEMGHQVHYTSGKPTLSSYDWTPSEYGSSNSAERFAETFVQYIFAPVELKKASPSAYKWVEDTLSSSLKEVEKWK